jgi:branched-chain amino acid transport system substrate-binding protein
MDGKRRWVFKTPANDSVYATAIVRHMSQHGVKTVSVIAFDDPYGESNTQAYKELADRMGIQTLAIEKFKRLDTSVTGQVLHAMKGNPDAVYIVASGSPAALPQMTLIDRGYKGKLYQTSGVVNDDFLRVGGKALEGTFVPTSPAIISEQLPNGYPTKAESVRFAKTYGAKFGSPSFFAALMWDALGITNLAVPKALQTAKPGTVEFREALRAAIENTRGYKGASAVFSYSPTDHAGVNQFGTTLSRIENGKWKLVEWASFK